MELAIGSRLRHAWNAFVSPDPTAHRRSYGSTNRPDRVRLRIGNERSIVTSIYNRIAIDAAAISFQHVRLDQNERYESSIQSGLNECLTLNANIDQTGRAFIQDVVASMCDEGCVAIIPVDTTINPTISGGYDINSLRVGKIIEWFPTEIRTQVYNEKTGKRRDNCSKKHCRNNREPSLFCYE